MSYRLIRQSLTPLIIADCAGMLVSGGFILVKGAWQVLWFDTLLLFISPMVFPLLMVPAALFGGLAKVFDARNKPLANVLLAASVACLIFTLSFTAAWSFETASGLHGGLTGPALLWGAAGAAAPWAVFARLDRENVFFTGLVVMLHAGCLAAATAALSHTLSFWDRFWIVAGVMAVLASAQAAYEAWFMKKA